MQIPGAFFNTLNSFELLQNFGAPVENVQKRADDKLSALPA